MTFENRVMDAILLSPINFNEDQLQSLRAISSLKCRHLALNVTQTFRFNLHAVIVTQIKNRLI